MVEHYSIVDAGSFGAAPARALLVRQDNEGSEKLSAMPAVVSPLVGARDQESPIEIAERELHITLQLLAQRAKQITNASAVSIAICDGGSMICQARVGETAPALKSTLEIGSGLRSECIQTQKILRCDNTATDRRADSEAYCALGIASVISVPVVQEKAVTGLFELSSDRVGAFQAQDVDAITHLAELIQTAIQHSDAIQRGALEIAAGQTSATTDAPASPIATIEEEALPESPLIPEAARAASIKIHSCSTCGFPISEGRKLCVDCEANSDQNLDGSPSPSALLVDQWREKSQRSWLRENIYAIGIVIVFAITIVFLFWTKRL
jgi:putative methionine-R-sulfoxide reductase with GAF domain